MKQIQPMVRAGLEPGTAGLLILESCHILQRKSVIGVKKVTLCTDA